MIWCSIPKWCDTFTGVSRNKEQRKMMCILGAEMEVGSLIVSLNLTVVETVWRIGNTYLPQTVTQECLLELHVHSDVQGQVCACIFRWAHVCMDPEIWLQRALWPLVKQEPLTLWAPCGRAAGLDVNRPCWGEANHGLILLYSSHANVCHTFCIPRTLMASTHVNHNIYITEVKTGKCVHSLVGHRRTPWCVTFHPTIPGLIASGCLDGEVRIWDLHVSLSWNICSFDIWWGVTFLGEFVLPGKRAVGKCFWDLCLKAQNRA